MKARGEFGPVQGFRWPDGLLGPDDVDPVGHERAQGKSPFLLICDHAGNCMPASHGRYGLSPDDFDRHYAYDIGALPVSLVVSQMLEAELIYQRYSRLLIDCNRPPHAAGAFISRIDGVRIAGNERLEPQQIAARVAEIFHPYHARIEAAIARRLAAGQPPVVVSIHSFTPSHSDFPDERPWHISVLFNRDSRYANAVVEKLRAEPNLIVGVNEPYGVDDHGDYALPVHCERLGLLHIELEIRQDLIDSPDGQSEWGARLSSLLPASLRAIGVADHGADTEPT